MSHIKKNSALGLFSLPHSDKKHIPIINECSLTKGIDFAIICPMLFATGAGAGSRLSLGTAVVFGMAVNAVLGTLFVPNFWELFENFREKYLSKMFAGSNVRPSAGLFHKKP